ncbi:MAG: sulfonate transport system ATP-binding protein [Alphaproteobacteria bacterium]|jgi:NitT/TauT family transport system ATP-binding protein|nr:sulfonate transport system ATP-binding protein [Alphaproteobacteria bacterium]
MTAVAPFPPVGEVTVEDVSKLYGDESAGKTAVSHCSFTASKGKFTVLIGPSGCGKTTLINLIAGYEAPSGGRVLLDGAPVEGPDSERLVVFQETALFPWMTVFDNVLYGPTVRHVPRVKAETETMAMLAKVGLQDFRDKYPNQLSGGMQRRAELARALINRPRVLLMDEPFRGLDAMTRELMQQYLLNLFEGSGQTVLFVTSEIDEAILLADTLVLLTRAPASTKSVVAVDLPRPRDASLFAQPRYAVLKKEVLAILYEEAVKAFASGSRASADLVEAVRARQDA